MTRFILLFCIGFLMGCAQQQPHEGRTLTSETTQNIESTAEQEMLFGHHENVNTVYGGSYEGCCIFNKDRVKLALFIIDLFEEKTGEEFGDRDMLIGTTNEKVLVYIEPSAKMKAITKKSYYVEINKATAKVEGFRQGEQGPN